MAIPCRCRDPSQEHHPPAVLPVKSASRQMQRVPFPRDPETRRLATAQTVARSRDRTCPLPQGSGYCRPVPSRVGHWLVRHSRCGALPWASAGEACRQTLRAPPLSSPVRPLLPPPHSPLPTSTAGPALPRGCLLRFLRCCVQVCVRFWIAGFPHKLRAPSFTSTSQYLCLSRGNRKEIMGPSLWLKPFHLISQSTVRLHHKLILFCYCARPCLT